MGELAKLALLWQDNNATELARATDDVVAALYVLAFRDSEPAETPVAAQSAVASVPLSTVPVASAPAPSSGSPHR